MRRIIFFIAGIGLYIAFFASLLSIRALFGYLTAIGCIAYLVFLYKTAPESETSGLAVDILVIGLLTLCCFGFSIYRFANTVNTIKDLNNINREITIEQTAEKIIETFEIKYYDLLSDETTTTKDVVDSFVDFIHEIDESIDITRNKNVASFDLKTEDDKIGTVYFTLTREEITYRVRY